MPSRSAALARHEFRMMARDRGMIISLVVMPALLIAFLKPAFGPLLEAQGVDGASGAEQAVPGIAVLFAFLASTTVAWTIFRDHGWNTWDRLRASEARPSEILAGKVAPSFTLTLVQLVALFVMGVVAFGLEIRGPVLGVVAVSVVLAVCLTAFGTLITSVLRSTQEVNTASNVLGMGLAGLGGAFTPLESLPAWAAALAPVSPAYWAMRGYRAAILDTGVVDVVVSCGVLLGFAAVFAGVAARRFRFDEVKYLSH